MNEFSLIKSYFQSLGCPRQDVDLGIGDDGACVTLLPDHQLVVSCDTLVADVHFSSHWAAYDIGYKAAMVNISDLAAMGATPCWMLLALTLPTADPAWLEGFSAGLDTVLKQYQMVLIGGDTTRGPLSMTLTVQGQVPVGQAIKRSGAHVGDKIYVTGSLGGAAFALQLAQYPMVTPPHQKILQHQLHYPTARVAWGMLLREYASAAIDISDGLSSDLNHMAVASGLGACLQLSQLPYHPLLLQYAPERAHDMALHGGDDYELCFTIPACNEHAFLVAAEQAGLLSYCIGMMESLPGVRGLTARGDVVDILPCGYHHFTESSA